jgi:putative phage-type endonuclease
MSLAENLDSTDELPIPDQCGCGRDFNGGAIIVDGQWRCTECDQPALIAMHERNRSVEKPKGRRYPGTHALVYAPPAKTHLEFLTTRLDGLGGSDIGPIAGVSPYSSAFQVYMQKTGQVPIEDTESDAIRWGNLLEGPIVSEFSRITGMGVCTNIGTLQHPERPWMLVNLDAVATEAPGKRKAIGVVEAKSGGLFGRISWDSEELPDHYMLQVQHELEVSGLDRAWVPAFLGFRGFVLIDVVRNDALIKSMLEIEEAFWERVINRTPPPLDGLPSTGKLLNRLHDVEPEKIVELPMELDVPRLIAQRNQATAAIKAAEMEKAKADNTIKAVMGSAEYATLGGKVVCTWKANKNGVRTFKPKEEVPTTTNPQKAELS